jgi:hypothetical protein
MKKAIIINVLLGVSYVLLSFNIQAQGINFGATRSGFHPGDTLMIPLRLSGSGITGGQITFNYDQSVLAPQAVLFDQRYSVNGLSFSESPFYATGIYNTIFYTNGTAIPAMTNKLVGYFCFIYTGGASGTTTLHLRHSPDAEPVCHFTGASGEITINSYSSDFTISGTTGTSAITLSSLSTGGPFDWDDPNAWIASTTPPSSGVLSPEACFNVFVTGDEVDINGTTPGPAKCNNLTINSAGKLSLDPNLYGSIVLTLGGAFTI